MSKHVHPTDFRLAKGVKFSSTEKYSIETNSREYANTVLLSKTIEDFIRDFFFRAGYLINDLQIKNLHPYVIISGSAFNASLYETLPHKTSKRKNVHSLSKEDLQFLGSALSKFINGIKNYKVFIKWDICFSQIEKAQLLSEKKKLQSSLRNAQRFPFFYTSLDVFLLATQGPSAELIACFLAKTLENTSNHQVLLDFTNQLFVEVSKLKSNKLKASLIKVKGRINGSDRAVTFKKRHGSIPLNTLAAPIYFASQEAKTKFGTLNIKIYLRY